MKKIFYSISIFLVLLSSCEKEEVSPEPDYLIFGHFYGFCSGERCIEIFKLEKDKLLEDTKDIYPTVSTLYEGTYTQLSQEKFDEVKDLLNQFPEDLLNETAHVIGQPDAGDWGGLYIEYSSGGFRKFWLLDQLKSNVPTKYHQFIDKVNEKISKL